jgi:hypothetical protein
MQNDKEHLNVDLDFLAEAKPRDAETKAASTYKVNWRNITIIGSLVGAFIGWVALSDKSSPSWSTSTSYTPPSTYQPNAPANQPPVVDREFRCSTYDSNHADSMAPRNAAQLTQEGEELKRRGDVLDSLKLQLDTSGVTQYSDQALVRSYNSMVARYNAQLSSLKTDYASYQTRIDNYYRLLQARNSYLITHCKKGW